MGEKQKLPQAKGLVEEALPSLTFRVRLEDERIILAHLSGRMKINRIVVSPGDYVIVEVSPDGRRGRIIKRL